MDTPHPHTHVWRLLTFPSIPDWSWMLLQYHEKASYVSNLCYIYSLTEGRNCPSCVRLFYTLSSLAAGKQLYWNAHLVLPPPLWEFKNP